MCIRHRENASCRPTPTWSALVCSDTRPTVTLSFRPCTRLRGPGRAPLPIVALRRRPGGVARPRPPYACAGPLERYRCEARPGRRVVRCALLGPPAEPGSARSAAGPCQLHSFLVFDTGTERCVSVPVKKVLQSVSYTHLRAHETVLDLVC